jgi:nitroreductase
LKIKKEKLMEILNVAERTAGIDRHISIHEPLARRRSPKGFLPRPVEAERLARLFEAARWAPSSFNEQPWRFIVATEDNHDEFEQLLRTLTPKNQEWAKHAGALIAVAAKLNLERNGKANRHALYDTGGAVANLTTQAVSLGLQVHQMAGFDSSKLRETVGIPWNYEPMAVLAVGYADEVSLLQKQRVRKELGELVFEGVWSNTARIVEKNEK